MVHAPVSRFASFVGKPFLDLMLHGTLRTRVVLEHKGKVLMVRGRLGTQRWSLPGGGVKKNEDPVDGAIREVGEEVSVYLSPDRLKKFSEGKNTRTKRLYFNYVAYAAKIESSAVQIDRREILEAEWFSLDKLPTNTSDMIKTILQDYQKYSA